MNQEKPLIEDGEIEEHSEEIVAQPEMVTIVRKRKNEDTSVQTKTKRKSKKGIDTSTSSIEGEIHSDSKTSDSSASSASSSSPVISVDAETSEPSSKKSNKRRKVDTALDGAGAKQQASKLSKKEQAVQDFMLDILPALKKNLKQRKTQESQFKIKEHAEYFQPTSKAIPTYCLRLFFFLGTEEIICSRYGNFSGNKHMVKTDAGFNHASLLINHCDSITEEESSYLMKKYGTEWFKIPSKDAAMASSANHFGDKGLFKMILVGLYEDSFKNDTGEELQTINPILRYQPIKAKKEKERE